MQNHLPSRPRTAFTLIELVVVLLIIAVIAGLVIPQVSMLGRTADMAASAKTQADIANNLQLYFVLQKRYPQGMDSLITTEGTIFAADTTDPNTQTEGLPYAGADGTRLQDQLTVGTLTNAAGAEFLRSFTRSGFEFVYDHDVSVINSNNSATTQRSLTSPVNVAEVTGDYMRNKLAPGPQVTAGVPGTSLDTSRERIIALGVGQNIASTGKTMINSPIYPGCDGKYYGRYIAYFKVYANGERATLIGVSDSYGRTPDYTQQQFNESLPDGGRQG